MWWLVSVLNASELLRACREGRDHILKNVPMTPPPGGSTRFSWTLQREYSLRRDGRVGVPFAATGDVSSPDRLLGIADPRQHACRPWDQ